MFENGKQKNAVLHVVLYLLVFTQLVQAVKRLAADIAYQWIKIRLVVIYSGLALVHAMKGTLSHKSLFVCRALVRPYVVPDAHSKSIFEILISCCQQHAIIPQNSSGRPKNLPVNSHRTLHQFSYISISSKTRNVFSKYHEDGKEEH